MTIDQAISEANAILPETAVRGDGKDPRWQAMIAIADFIESDPEPIWAFVARWGIHADRDLRTAVATVLLEHLLERHFDLIFPRVEALVRRDANFAETFATCWKFGEAELAENARRFDALKGRKD
jgi:hypothetical protein